jgi:multidrug efflux system membrane fusion protein
MQFHLDTTMGKLVGRILSAAIVVGALILGLAVLYRSNRYPQTDDSEILANFIGIAPQVEGPIIHLNVRDNQFVKHGTLLFEIDDRPYRYALERTISEQATLEGQIGDERRRIAALVSAVSVAQATSRRWKPTWPGGLRRSIRHGPTSPTPSRASGEPRPSGGM